ncbi:MAG TPA: nucleotide sugar dehydrogenase [Candidatus Paceibacterota bacterium]|jgi:nucleotide sugar dehydrogenase|nr:nucleotide sugar dehydrogenase [Candidatus Paceibacterota bacterium]
MKHTKQEGKKIAVVGLGAVGLPLALLADHKGYHVIGIDVNPEVVERLSRRESPFLDRNLEKQTAKSRLDVTNDFSRVKEAAVVIVGITTSVREDRTPDLVALRAACRNIAPHVQKGQLVIVESAVNPGTCESVVLPILEKGSHLRGGLDFDLAYCPERTNPGDEKWHVEKIPRVVGGLDPVSLKRAISFYKTLLKGEIKPMSSLKEAEAVKIVENAFRDVNIAFVNELAVSFSKLGIDVLRVIEGASTKPFGFMPFYPGGVGGRFIPVDPYALIDVAGENGFEHRILALAREINDDMPRFVVERLEKTLEKHAGKLARANIAVLGLAYKPDIDDARESPSHEIVRILTKKGANVRTYDPYIKDQSSAKTLHDALAHADGVIIATAHEPFRALRPHDFVKHGIRVVVDGRNCLPKEDFVKAGIAYQGVGR